jgi:hypothetical protein
MPTIALVLDTVAPDLVFLESLDRLVWHLRRCSERQAAERVGECVEPQDGSGDASDEEEEAEE